MISRKDLKKVIHYHPATGVFTWKQDLKNGRKQGTIAGYITQKKTTRPRLYIEIQYRAYIASRLAWYYMTGIWSKNFIDHINRNTLDNRFDNLREATHSQNQANTNKSKKNTSGIKGVVRFRKGWAAQIGIGGRKTRKTIRSQRFNTIEEAQQARQALEKKYQGKYATPGVR